jgi:hypothetical protein
MSRFPFAGFLVVRSKAVPPDGVCDEPVTVCHRKQAKSNAR